jgi:hypothetical protein
MQQNTVQMEDTRLNVPDGGIASFVSADDDDDREDFGSQGIAQFPALAQRMAAMGRGGDDTLAHVQTGELIIPAALLAQDPALKEGLFQRLRDMGIEDPERYVVGSEGNSLNPETGIPEFFFKKIIKGIKKASKPSSRSSKKSLRLFCRSWVQWFLVPIYGAALGSGIATLINGGSFKDALKSAAVSGITGGIGAGVSGVMSGAGFGAGVKAALNPGNIRAGFSAIKTGFTEGFGQTGVGFESMKYGLAGSDQISAEMAEQAALAPTLSSGAGELSGAGTPTGAGTQTRNQTSKLPTPKPTAFTAPDKAPGFVESIKAAFTPNDGH